MAVAGRSNVFSWVNPATDKNVIISMTNAGPALDCARINNNHLPATDVGQLTHDIASLSNGSGLQEIWEVLA